MTVFASLGMNLFKYFSLTSTNHALNLNGNIVNRLQHAFDILYNACSSFAMKCQNSGDYLPALQGVVEMSDKGMGSANPCGKLLRL
ncbi:MAG: hypothetical protein R3295_07950 [Marinobacter sp.]|nr:hypothetical protein [Marinobacter sp.]